jgi:hypothetical protein
MGKGRNAQRFAPVTTYLKSRCIYAVGLHELSEGTSVQGDEQGAYPCGTIAVASDGSCVDSKCSFGQMTNWTQFAVRI